MLFCEMAQQEKLHMLWWNIGQPHGRIWMPQQALRNSLTKWDYGSKWDVVCDHLQYSLLVDVWISFCKNHFHMKWKHFRKPSIYTTWTSGLRLVLGKCRNFKWQKCLDNWETISHQWRINHFLIYIQIKYYPMVPPQVLKGCTIFNSRIKN